MAKLTQQLSLEQFHQLQEYTLYARKALKQALAEFVESSCDASAEKVYPEGLSYEEFRSLLQHFLNVDVGEQLTHSLFDSFREAPQRHRQQQSKNTAGQPTDEATHPDDVPISSSPRQKGKAGADSEPVPVQLLDAHDAVAAVGSIISERRASLSDIMCYLSLLEAGKPEEKLEFMFKMYDVDNSNYLENEELDCIMTRMVTVAEYLGWDTTELKPILKEMLADIDSDDDGKISLQEWIEGGLHTIPLLVLLGLETKMKDGLHQWRLKHFNHPAFCNICRHMLLGVGKQGLVCSFCHYTVHERCVARVGETCLSTYTKSCKGTESMQHHWVEGNAPGKCDRCGKTVKAMNALTGLKCAWCHKLVHNTCVADVPTECDLGQHRCHTLPPISIVPAVLQSHPSSHTSQATTPKSVDTSTFSFESLDTKVMPLAGTSPLAVFINPKSGGKQGIRLVSKFQYLLNPRQVFNLAHGGPAPGVRFFAQVPNCRVLCCGGDGTVGWVLSVIDDLGLDEKPPIGVLPLGTGNDLARCLAWGGGYEGEDLGRILHQLRDATVVKLDRWQLHVEPAKEAAENEEKGDPVPLDIMNNYFSVGVDASIAHKFHVMRENYPEKFKSRMRNKMWYFEFGAGEMLSASCRDLHEHISLQVDGKAIDLSTSQLEGIAVLNIPSMYGGTNVWGQDERPKRTWSLSRSASLDHPLPPGEFKPQDISDMLLEVVGLESSLYVGQLKAGLRGHGQRLAQGNNIVITTKQRFPMQIDGEPWVQPPCTITISHKNQVPMLRAPKLKKQKTASLFFFKDKSGALGTAV